MIASEARIAANRKNAQLSTGPRTPEGKERSRANALKHGLCATVLVAEDIDSVIERSNQWTKALKPQNEYHGWLVGKIAVNSIRLDRCERMERRLRDRHSLRAEVDWDEQRRHDAETIGERIARRPAPTVQALRRTPQGCDWLIERWAMLAHAADTQGSWTAAQAEAAFDLMGTPPEYREGRRPGATIDLDGHPVEPGDDPAALARLRIAELRGRRAVVAGLDEADRALSAADLFDEGNPELRRLRRYESALHTRIRWFMSQLHYESPHKGPHYDGWPRWVIRPEEPEQPEAAPAPEPPKAVEVAPAARIGNPPIDLEPHEVPPPGVRPDIPAILAARCQAKRDRAESRRQARRRKLERLRA